MAEVSTLRRLVANSHGGHREKRSSCTADRPEGQKREAKATAWPPIKSAWEVKDAASASPDLANGRVRRACLCMGGLLGADGRRAEPDESQQVRCRTSSCGR